MDRQLYANCTLMDRQLYSNCMLMDRLLYVNCTLKARSLYADGTLTDWSLYGDGTLMVRENIHYLLCNNASSRVCKFSDPKYVYFSTLAPCFFLLVYLLKNGRKYWRSWLKVTAKGGVE
jgi:hypothetical protein